MKSEKLMDYIGQIDDSIIVEADVHSAAIRPVKRSWIKWASVAAIAVVCLIVAVPFMLNRTQPINPIGISGLPKLSVNVELDGAFGFQGHLAYDISQLNNGNPWTEDNNLTVMPVFANPMQYDSAGAPINGLSAEEMLAKAEEIASLLGLEVTLSYTVPTMDEIEQIKQKLEAVDASDEEVLQNITVYLAAVECNGPKIVVQKDGRIILTLTPATVGLINDIGKLGAYNNFVAAFEYEGELIGDTRYSTGLPLPDGRLFSFYDIPYEQAMEITQYLFSEYGAFTGITSPGYDLFADYTYNGVLTRLHTTVFENAGSLTERILNYHFNRLSFSATDLGGLGAISYYRTDLSQKIGDYPIVTAAEARALLLNNHYITTVPEALPGVEYIAHVELTYRTGRLDTVFMPYYKFLVEMPAMERDNGLKTFGVFYVPAVQSEFLENMPLWDGSFN